MSNPVLLALSGALLMTATPVLARDVAGTGAGQAPAEQTRPAAKTTRYCVEQKFTGSRIAKRDCRTRDEWLQEGYDPALEKQVR